MPYESFKLRFEECGEVVLVRYGADAPFCRVLAFPECRV
jgi:hypothetical protein